jgi:hypothetical protein
LKTVAPDQSRDRLTWLDAGQLRLVTAVCSGFFSKLVDGYATKAGLCEFFHRWANVKAEAVMKLSRTAAVLSFVGALSLGAYTPAIGAPLTPLSAAAMPADQSNTVQVRWRGGWGHGGWGLGFGALAAGALIGGALASAPYYGGYGYNSCYYGGCGYGGYGYGGYGYGSPYYGYAAAPYYSSYGYYRPYRRYYARPYYAGYRPYYAAYRPFYGGGYAWRRWHRW